VLNHVLAELADSVGGAVDGVHRGHPLLEALALGVVQARGDLVRGLVELLRIHPLRQVQLDQPGLVVDRDGRAILDGLSEVVDQLDVLAEDVAGVPVGEGDRGAGERDERGVRQRVAQVAGVAVEVVVVGAVSLVNDDDDVAASGKPGVGPAVLTLFLTAWCAIRVGACWPDGLAGG